MRAAINQTLDLLDRMLEPGGPSGKAMHRELRANIEQVQDAYIEVVQQALRLLMLNRLAESHELLQQQRNDLESTFARIGTLIEDISEEDEPLIKATVEYLFTRARLVDELKMFPAFGVELLERMSLDDSIDATVEYMEAIMTGKKNLYSRVVNALAEV
jgi:hypothetical protein